MLLNVEHGFSSAVQNQMDEGLEKVRETRSLKGTAFRPYFQQSR
jgi:hypothetical protein